MTRAPLRAAVIGAGVGGRLSIAALARSRRFELAAVADMRADALERVSKDFGGEIALFEDPEAMLARGDLDVVCVSTYAPTHEQFTMSALAAGARGLLVEKPLGHRADSGAAILAAVRLAHVPVVVPHGLMAMSGSLAVIDAARNGAIGEIRFVEIECSGWDLINAGIHWLQFSVALIGRPALSVLSAADVSTRTYRDGLQVETEAITLAHFGNGVRVYLNTGDDLQRSRSDTDCLIRVIGSTGWMEYGVWEQRYTLIDSSGRTVIEVEPFAETPHQRHLEYLADQVEAGVLDYALPDASLAALRIVEASYLSARSGASVTIGEELIANPAPEWALGEPYPGHGGGRNGQH
jgi:predicted dehydrogenase